MTIRLRTARTKPGEFAGAYDGAAGTYRCNGFAQCTVTLDANGRITAMSTGWIFTPDRAPSSTCGTRTYLHYGFWLKKTTDDEGAVTYNEIETFAGSSVPVSGNLAAIMGRATHEGGAAGVYVIKTRYDPSTGELVDANSGRFAADARLTATFGQTDARGHRSEPGSTCSPARSIISCCPAKRTTTGR